MSLIRNLIKYRYSKKICIISHGDDTNKRDGHSISKMEINIQISNQRCHINIRIRFWTSFEMIRIISHGDGTNKRDISHQRKMVYEYSNSSQIEIIRTERKTLSSQDIISQFEFQRRFATSEKR